MKVADHAMTASDELATDNARQAQARFFLGVGRTKSKLHYGDGVSEELFGLELILEAEGMLAKEMR